MGYTLDWFLEGGRGRCHYSNILVSHASLGSSLLQSTLLHATTKDVLVDEFVEAVFKAPSREDVVDVPRTNLPSTDLNLQTLLDEARGMVVVVIVLVDCRVDGGATTQTRLALCLGDAPVPRYCSFDQSPQYPLQNPLSGSLVDDRNDYSHTIRERFLENNLGGVLFN